MAMYLVPLDSTGTISNVLHIAKAHVAKVSGDPLTVGELFLTVFIGHCMISN